MLCKARRIMAATSFIESLAESGASAGCVGN
jgi:hypothetical protein